MTNQPEPKPQTLNKDELEQSINQLVMSVRSEAKREIEHPGTVLVPMQGRVNRITKVVDGLITTALKQQLKNLLVQHDAVCGARFAKNPRDDCTLRQQIFDELRGKL